MAEDQIDFPLFFVGYY